MSSERTHTLYSPSRLTYLALCPGWQGDGESSAMAERGTAIGERLAAFMTAGVDPLDGCAPEDRDALAYGAEVLRQIADRHGSGALEWHAERYLETGITDCAGYSDLIALDTLLGEAVLVEIKTGRGERPAAADNAQVRSYALGLLHEYRWVDVVTAYLIECDQERVTEASWIRADMARLRSQTKVLVLNAGHPSEAELCPGRHCAYCARREQCPPLAASADQALAVIGPRTLTPKDYAQALSQQELGDTLARVAPLAALVDTYVGALKARTMQILEAGGEVPGWMIRTRGGARSWADEEGAMHALQAAGVDLSELTTLVSPAQVEKRIGKEVAPLVAPFVRKAENRSLVPVAQEEPQ